MNKMPRKNNRLKKNTAMRAYHDIKNKLLRNQLDFEFKINENELASNLNVSRTPIREALFMLEGENLIRRDEATGFYINRFSIKDIEDIYDFREGIEIYNIAKLIDNITENDLDELRIKLDAVHNMIIGGNASEAFVEGLGFHLALLEIGGNVLSLRMLKNCLDKLTMIAWSFQNIERCKIDLQEHFELLKVIKEGNCDKIRSQYIRHIRLAKERAIDVIRMHKDKWYFNP